MNVIFTISFFLPLFYFVLLISKKEKQLSDKILALLILSLGLHLLSSFLKNEGYWDIYPHLVGVTVPLPFVYGPLIYLYIYYSINNSESFNKRKLIHFVPFVLVTLFMSRFYFFYSLEEKRLVDAGKIHDFDLFTNIILIAFAVLILYYIFKSFQLVLAYKKALENNFSNVRIIDINWVRGIIGGFASVFLIIISWGIFKEITDYQYVYDNDIFLNFLLLIMFLIFGFFGIRTNNIFGNKKESIIIEDNVNKETGSIYEHSGLKDDLAHKKHIELLYLMKNDKPYLEPKLSLRDLAEKLSISPNYLSQIINQYEKHNFNDFVNQYRIEEFVIKAKNNKNYSLLAIALDSGFNSKSTFNTVFKKHKGITPSQFLSSNPV